MAILLLLLLLGAVVWEAGLQAGLLLLIGLALGHTLQSTRFGFTRGWRDLIEERRAEGVLSQCLLIGLAILPFHALIALAGPAAQPAVAPLSTSMLIGAFVFGMAMQAGDGCGSGTLYKAGAGHVPSLVVLPFMILGSFLGARDLPFWLSMGSPLAGPAGSSGQTLQEAFGLGPVAAGLMGLGLCAALTLFAAGVERQRHGRWPKIPARPWLVGAGLLALLSLLHFIVAGQPWGIVYGLGLWGAKLASAIGWEPSGGWLHGQHLLRLEEPALWDTTSLTNLGLMLGAAVALHLRRRQLPEASSGLDHRPISSRPWRSVAALALTGLVLGYSSRLAFGCNIGGFVAGTLSGSLHGWVWMLMAAAGSLLGVRLRRLTLAVRPAWPPLQMGAS